jgi:hypothetical protein
VRCSSAEVMLCTFFIVLHSRKSNRERHVRGEMSVTPFIQPHSRCVRRVRRVRGCKHCTPLILAQLSRVKLVRPITGVMSTIPFIPSQLRSLRLVSAEIGVMSSTRCNLLHTNRVRLVGRFSPHRSVKIDCRFTPLRILNRLNSRRGALYV